MRYALIAAPHKSSGKTTVTLGLAAALRARGLQVQPFKKGPDYIDPLWLGEAAGRPCHNLDFNTQTEPEIRALFTRHAQTADVALIEGNLALFDDSQNVTGEHSNAGLAALLGAPVVLVINTQGMGRSVVPLVLGYAGFVPAVRLCGVILNNVAGQRHEANLRRALAYYTDIPVLGAVQRNAAWQIAEEHLGLVPSNEQAGSRSLIDQLGAHIAEAVDLDAFLGVCALAGAAPAAAPSDISPSAPAVASDALRQSAAPALVRQGKAVASVARAGEQHAQPVSSVPAPRALDVGPDGADPVPGMEPVRIGLARDRAFGFYYQSDLDALQAAGAELLPFDTLRDAQLPAVDGLFIGGGFPERQMTALADNRSLLADIRAFIEAGGPAYAECGGLMYLCRTLIWGEKRVTMAGAIAADVVMHPRPQGRGYTRLQVLPAHPWLGAPEPWGIRAHEFHFSGLRDLDPSLHFGFRVERGHGVDGQHDGLLYRNLVANYCHLRDTDGLPWAARFVAYVRTHRCGRPGELPADRTSASHRLER